MTAIERSALHPEWKELVEQTKACEYDSFFTHARVAVVLGMGPERGRADYRMVGRWKNELLSEHQRYVISVHEKGYRVVKPNEHQREMRQHIRKIKKVARHGIAVGHATAIAQLTDEENRAHADTLAKMGSLAVFTEQVQRETRPAMYAAKLPDRPRMLGK